jgi:hypothetical protein
MMLVFLGFMDFLILALILAMNFDYHPSVRMVSLAMLYLIGKSIIFRGSIFNWIDALIAIFILFMYFGMGLHGILVWLIIIYLAYKLVAILLA